MTLLETRFSGLYLRLPSVDFTWVLNQLNLLEIAFSWCYFRFEPFWFYLRLHSVQTAFNLPDAAFQETFLLSQSSGHESDWEVSTKSGGDPSYIHTTFLPHQSKPFMHFWCTFDALLMHFQRVHELLGTFWKCSKSASKVHQKFTKNALKVHQKFIKISSKLHQKLISTSRIQFLWGRFAEHILNLQLWFTEKNRLS